ncbi:MAG: hypothetical protein J0L92_10280 [Deltaproteobacteria bacterium]|nr:hypothetical protein [Deltaproteobacteria bacterium]
MTISIRDSVPTLFVSLALTVPAALAGCGGATTAVEETTPVQETQAATPLIIGGAQSNFGGAELATGFLPDPHQVQVVSGATPTDAVDINSLSLSPVNSGACRGYSTREPDYIVRVTQPGQLLRFFVNAPGDTTLVINDGAGRWWCSDDDGGNLNPLIDIASPPPGQYDIWVGSYQAGANIQGVLSVSELTTSTP